MRVRDGRRATGMLAAIAVAAIPMAVGAQTASAQEGSADPLGFLEPLIGTWVSAPEWLEERPGMEGLVPIAFEWGSDRTSIVEHSGLPAEGRLGTVGLIVWDPVREQARFLASQGSDDLYFEGYYEPIGGGVVRRVYWVYRPDGSSDEYRETFFPRDDGSVDWLTERRDDGRFVPRGASSEPEYRIVRMPEQTK